MLKTGKEHLECLRDGREVYIGGEKVDDVTTHPAFAASAQSIAALYDMKADPANRDLMSFEEDGERFSMYYLKPTSQDDCAAACWRTRKLRTKPAACSGARRITCRASSPVLP